MTAPTCPMGFDPLSPAYLEEPHRFWHYNVGDDRVFYYEPMKCWVVTGRDEVSQAFVDSAHFSSHIFQAVQPTAELRERLPKEIQELPADLMQHTIINLDPPDHTTQRKVVQRVFTPRVVQESEDAIRARVNGLIDTFIDRGSCEIMGEYAHALTIGVISQMIGLPEDMLPKLPRWIGSFFGLMAPIGADSQYATDELEGHYLGLADAVAEVKVFLAERQAHPTADLASRMVAATNPDGSRAMSDEQIITHIIELFAAGSDTTANLIGHTIRWVAERPELRKQLADDPDLWTGVIEESLRRSGIVNTLGRVTMAEVEIGGITIPARSLVLLIPAGAGSDPRTFAAALDFDPARADLDSHIAFGGGRHMCIGAPLARLETRLALEELFRRIPDLAIPEQKVEYTGAMTVRGIKALTATWPV
ncbi:cytochrome P450 [Nocardia sp. NPDC050378]|uniref:cytochrome P450 n=1 Tax=Nocardia sp. NPDC050378 TaxID=3155400 RepID=UPI0033FD1D82